jgi:hypothetical protein
MMSGISGVKYTIAIFLLSSWFMVISEILRSGAKDAQRREERPNMKENY